METQIKKLVDEHGFIAVFFAIAKIARKYSAPKLADKLVELETADWA